MSRSGEPLPSGADIAVPGLAEAPQSRPAPEPQRAPGPRLALGDTPTVIYIAGSGRSGSTLLERVLGGIPGFVNVGELIDLFRWTAFRGERCGCGHAFASCPFWTGVGARVFSGWDSEQLTTMHRLQKAVARQRHLPKLVAPRLAGRGFRTKLAAFGKVYASLYRAIAAESGASWIVDASKWPFQALALRRAGIDVRVVHLVRDVRGVAHSLGKQITRPHAMEQADQMSHQVPAEAAARWLAIQGQAELLRRCGVSVTRVRYEDFVRQPGPVVRAALAALGLPAGDMEPSWLAHVEGASVVLGPSHGLSGNPSRFSDGKISLRADEAWRDQMPRRDRLVITAIGLPFLVRYRWSLTGGRKRRNRPLPADSTTSSPAQET